MGYYLGNQAIARLEMQRRIPGTGTVGISWRKKETSPKDWGPYPFSGDRRELIGVALPSTGDLKELPPDADRRDLIITLQRTSCYGTCRAYKLIIHENGRVIYDGIAYVRVRGKREGRIGQEKIRQLLKLLKEKEYLSLKDDDDPSVITSISVDGKRKRVRHYYGDMASPRRLYEIEGGIDAIVDSEQWVSGVLKRCIPEVTGRDKIAKSKGKVVLDLELADSGKVKRVRVLEGSGDAKLDHAAAESVRRCWKFAPSNSFHFREGPGAANED